MQPLSYQNNYQFFIQHILIVLSHPTGNANVRAAALGFAQSNLLMKFNTTVASFPGNLIDRIGAVKPFADIRRRRFHSALEKFTDTSPWYETGRLLASKTRLTKLVEHEKGIFCIDNVYKKLDKKVARHLKVDVKKGVKGIYAYEDGAAFSFREAKQLGLICLYDLPTGYWRAARRLLKAEQERRPEWASTLTGFQDSDIKLARKDEELQLADAIFVASRFTAKTLEDYSDKLAPVEIIPYGFPSVAEHKSFTTSSRKKLKLLFAGKLSQQKGIADLFTAIKKFHDYVELTLIGNKAVSNCVALNEELSRHCWLPSLSHEKILQIMREHDVLIFPSLFDGFGLVITEAMSQGTPVIASDRSAGPDLIEHDHNGWVFNAGSTDALQAIIEKLLLNPASIDKAGREAMETARKRPWKLYQQELAEAVRKYL